MRPQDPHHLGDSRHLGDTAEIPAVEPGYGYDQRPRRGGIGRALGLFAVLMVLTAAFVLIAIFPFSDSTDDATTVEQVDDDAVDDDSDDDDEDATGDPTPTAVVTDLADEPARAWQVTGVTDGLNVRAEPGVGAERLGALAPDSVVEATGRRADVNGSEWKQIRYDGGTGWVAASFLGDVREEDPDDTPDPDDAPNPDDADPVVDGELVCFQGPVVNASVALVATFDGTEVRGALRSDSSDTGVAISTFEGERLGSGRYEVTRESDVLAPWIETWEFRDDEMTSSNGWSVDEVRCSRLGDLLDRLRDEVPRREP